MSLGACIATLFHGHQHMLFKFHHLNEINARRIVPAQMQMGIDQTWHQGSTADASVSVSSINLEPNLFSAIGVILN